MVAWSCGRAHAVSSEAAAARLYSAVSFQLKLAFRRVPESAAVTAARGHSAHSLLLLQLLTYSHTPADSYPHSHSHSCSNSPSHSHLHSLPHFQLLSCLHFHSKHTMQRRACLVPLHLPSRRRLCAYQRRINRKRHTVSGKHSTST
eukprot:6203912-Pleurochrysis_carterae.AAC.1